MNKDKSEQITKLMEQLEVKAARLSERASEVEDLAFELKHEMPDEEFFKKKAVCFSFTKSMLLSLISKIKELEGSHRKVIWMYYEPDEGHKLNLAIPPKDEMAENTYLDFKIIGAEME